MLTAVSHAALSRPLLPFPPAPKVMRTQQGLQPSHLRGGDIRLDYLTTQTGNDPLPPGAAQSPLEPLETFVVPRPARISTPVVPHRAFTSPNSWTHPILQNYLNGEITYSSFPGLEPVLVDVAGNMGGRQVQSHLAPVHLLQSDTLNRNSFELSRDGQGVEIGGDNGGVSETGAGLRLFTSANSQHGAAGLGLYQRLGTGGFSLLPGVDTAWHPSKNLDMDLALAADSSLRLTQGIRLQGWTVQSFFGWDARQSQSQGALYVARQWKDTLLFERLSRFSSTASSFSWEQGLTRRVGPASLTVDTSLSRQADSSMQQIRLGLFRPLGRDLLSVRWEQGNASSFGSSQKSTQLTTLLTMPMPHDTLILVGDNLFAQSGSSGQHQTTVSASWTLGQQWNLQTGITRDWQEGRQRLNAAIGVWVTPDWQARLLVGPSPVAADIGGESSAFGFQLVHRFRVATFASGTVRGRVLLQGQPCKLPVRLQLEDQIVRTDSQGRFQFDHVPVGTHDIGFDLTSFPATLDAAVLRQTVQVSPGKTVDLVFSAQQIGFVRGRVEVGADAFGQTDLTAGMGLIITDSQGHETTTDADHRFTLGSLPLGRHTISLLPSSLPPGYEIVSVGGQDVEVVAAPAAMSEVVFRIAPHQQPVEMKAMTP